MVIPRDAYLSGDDVRVVTEVEQVKEACGDRAPEGDRRGRRAGRLRPHPARHEAGDGGRRRLHQDLHRQGGKGATPSVMLVMLEAVRDYVQRTGRVVGMKPAGGVRTSKQAIHQLVLVNETLGEEWLTPDRFRIGASSLLNDLLMQYEHGLDRPLPAARGLLEGVSAMTATAHAHLPGLGVLAGAGGDRSPPAARSLRAVHRRRAAAARVRRVRADDQPRDRGAAGRGRRRPARRRRRAPSPRRARRCPRGGAARARARQVRLPDRAPDPGARARAGDRRVARRRQADPRVARRRHPAGGGALLLLRGLGRQARATASRAAPSSRSASSARSCRGTSRC